MKSFLTACGLADLLQLVIENQSEAEGELRLFHQPFVIIGRDPRADLVLDHADVSRRHVYLQVVDGQAFWIDLESRAGTHQSGEAQKSGWLDSNHPIDIGPFLIRRFTGDSSIDRLALEGATYRAAPLLATALGNITLPDVSLEFLNGPSRATAWPVRRVMSLIGSASGCKFRLTDASVSRFHASLLRTPLGLWIVDLMGQGGIAVNDVPVRFRDLEDGDQLRIGRYQIRIRYQSGRQTGGGEPHERALAKPVGQWERDGNAMNALPFPERPTGAPTVVPIIEGPSKPEFPLAIQAFSSPMNVGAPASRSMYPVTSSQPELSETMLVPLVNQFGLMQQQMFDQFQQSMAMMVHMFGTMHRDQMAVIREELDRLREVTEEFHALKTELAERTKHEQSATPPSGPPNTAPETSRPAATTPISGAERAATRAPNRSEGLQPGQVEAKAVGQPQSSSASRVAERRPSGASTGSSAPPTVNPAQARRPAGEEAREVGSQPPPAPKGATAPADSERDSVVWLHQRIMTLQRERETRWQRILKLIPGIS